MKRKQVVAKAFPNLDSQKKKSLKTNKVICMNKQLCKMQNSLLPSNMNALSWANGWGTGDIYLRNMTLTFTNQCNFKILTECKIEWFKQSDDYLTLLHDHVHYLCLRLFILTRILFWRWNTFNVVKYCTKHSHFNYLRSV